jgi:hypothetical protein
MYGMDCMSRSSVSTKTMLGAGPGVGVDAGLVEAEGLEELPQAAAIRASGVHQTHDRVHTFMA